MKRIVHLILIFAAFALALCLTACGQDLPADSDGTESDATVAVSTGDADLSDHASDGTTDASSKATDTNSGKTEEDTGKTDSVAGTSGAPTSSEATDTASEDDASDQPENPSENPPEDVPAIEFEPQDAVGTWVADSGDYIYVEITENQTVNLLFGNKNSTELPISAIATDLREMGNNRWNVSISFDGGESSRGYSMTLLDPATVSFGQVGFEAQTYRLESEP